MRQGEEKVFLLVYCSGHGVTANCKQVYVLNSHIEATYNIEYRLRCLADKFDNFCHIFAIYDMCQSDMLNMPELLAVRGRPDGPDMEESDGRYDGYSSNQEEVPSVPYFHISSAQPGGTAAADSGFAAKCRLFSLEEAKRDPSGYDLVEFPSAWSRRFRKVSDPGKTYWIRVLENRITDGFQTTPEKEETRQDFTTPSKE